MRPSYTGSLAITSSNSVLNAAPFSLNGQSVPKPYMQRETIAFNIGGPVRIPKLVTNDKWFVYLTLQDARNRNGRESVSTVPTLAERNGDFSSAAINNNLTTIYDPLSGSPFPGNLIPTNRFNPASVALLQYFPLPIYSGIIQNYSISPSPPSSNNAVGVRLNGPVTPKDNLNFNVQYSGNSATTEQLFGFKDTSSGYGLSSTAGYRHVFRPRLNNNATLAFSRSQSTASPFFAYKENIAAQLGITGTDQTPIDYGPPNLSFTNFGGLTDGTASVNRAQTTNFTDTVTWVYQRKHNVTFGFGYRRMQNNALSYAGSRGSFNFGGLLTSGFNSDGTTIPNTGFDFADFLLGYPQTSTRRIGNSNNYFRGQAYNWYAQDDFRASARLTLNLGLRYEYFTPYTELQGHLANLDVNPTLTAVSVVTAQNAGGPYTGRFPAALVNPDRNNYSPRLGFAWRPSAKNNRLIRGGYSIFFSGSAYSQIATTMAAQPPFANSASLSTSLTAPLTLQNGFPLVGNNTIANTFAIDKNYKLAYAQTWSLALQQTLPQNLLLELEYIGTKGTGLNLLYVPNELPPNSPSSATANRSTTAFTYLTDHADSIFHAGQVRLTRRFARGMSAVALYTFSKSIDDASTFSGATNGTVIQDPNNFSADRGLSSFDQRHNFTLTYVLSSPVGIHGLFRNGGWKTKTFSGWTLQRNLQRPQRQSAHRPHLRQSRQGSRHRPVARRSHRHSHSGRPQSVLQYRRLRTPARRRIRRCRPQHHHRTRNGQPERLPQPRLPLRRIPPPGAVAPQRHQHAEPRADHRFRHHLQHQRVRTCHRRLRHPVRLPASPVELLICASTPLSPSSLSRLPDSSSRRGLRRPPRCPRPTSSSPPNPTW